MKLDFSGYNGVWVYCDYQCGVIDPASFGTIKIGRRIADEMESALSAVVIGENEVEYNILSNLLGCGADQIYSIQIPIAYYNCQMYCDALQKLIEMHKPEILLFPSTVYSRSLAPRIASRLGVGLTADCVKLEVENATRQLIQIRPAFSGNLLCAIKCSGSMPQMATVRVSKEQPDHVYYANIGRIITYSYHELKPYGEKHYYGVKQIVQTTQFLARISSWQWGGEFFVERI